MGYQSREDFRQFRELLKLLGYSSEYIEKIIHRQRTLSINRDKRMREELPEEGRASTYRSSLDMILYPDNEKLAGIPAFDRYVGHLISSKGTEDAARHLDMSRMGLYKWLKAQEYRS